MATSAADGTVQATGERQILGHPPGLWYLAFTEVWERFSFYGMQSLLVLYMAKHLLLPENARNVAFFEEFSSLYGGIEGQALASAIFGTYAACVYLTPILGGIIADRWLGKRLTVLAGALTMTAGHFLMAFEAAFLFALLCLIVGSGLFKGNIASQVGALYGPGDLRRADAFQMFYIGINAGVIASPLIVGTLGEKVGWHWGFGAAGVGMVIGLIIYLAGQKYLPKEHFAPTKASGSPERPKLTRSDLPAVLGLIVLLPVLAVAYLPNLQIFNAYLIWGDAQFALEWGGTKLPTTWLLTLDATVSVSALVAVVAFYRWVGRRWQEPDEITKMTIGSAFSIAGMLCLYLAAATQVEGAKIGLFWPVMFHVFNSIGFAHILPVSLALFARIAPPAINATSIGVYYLAFFFAFSLVGWVGGFYGSMPTTQFWLMHAGFAAVSGVVFILFKLLLMRRTAAG